MVFCDVNQLTKLCILLLVSASSFLFSHACVSASDLLSNSLIACVSPSWNSFLTLSNLLSTTLFTEFTDANCCVQSFHIIGTIGTAHREDVAKLFIL
jgi:hypothetical protein